MPIEIAPMQAEPTAIDGLWLIRPKAVTDERGTVREFLRLSAFAEAGIEAPTSWQQINLTSTVRGGLRGLHGEAMTKLVGVVAGAAFGAYLDARPASSTFGAVVTVELVVGVQVLVPAGVCNGFQATGAEGCQYLYCFDTEWAPGMAGVAVNPLDSDLAIAWPLPVDVHDPATISAKDAGAPSFAQLRDGRTDS